MPANFVPTQEELSLVDDLFAQGDDNMVREGRLEKRSEAAAFIFADERLTPEISERIWKLADTEKKGYLSRTDAAVALRLIGHAQAGEEVSESLICSPGPIAYIEGISPDEHRHTSTQLTFPLEQQPGLLASPPVTSSANPFTRNLSASVQWDITPAKKAKSDKFFHLLDDSEKGYIEGDVAVPFMRESKLSEDDLAQVWDLADLNNDGRLNRDEFAISMYLIEQKMSGIPIPSSLAPSLIPPLLRGSSGSLSYSPPTTQLGHRSSTTERHSTPSDNNGTLSTTPVPELNTAVVDPQVPQSRDQTVANREVQAGIQRLEQQMATIERQLNMLRNARDRPHEERPPPEYTSVDGSAEASALEAEEGRRVAQEQGSDQPPPVYTTVDNIFSVG